MKKNKEDGAIIILVLVFFGVMTTLIGGMAGFIFVQHHAQVKKIEKEKAFQIAEAGLDYYRWFLSHYPDDIQDGTGEAGPYEHEYYDPEGEVIGKFSLSISGVSQCGVVTAININSTGWTYAEPNITKTLRARYSRPSIAQFAYVLDQSEWFGEDEEIKGMVHSNGGIRMDGENDSLITSALETWNCTDTYGCASPFEVKPGIFGEGEGGEHGLWQFPAELISFDSISTDLDAMQDLAVVSGVFLPKSTDINPSGRGYHIVLRDDGTFDVYIITNLNRGRGWNSEQNWHWDYFTIQNQVFYGNYSLPVSCGLVFIKDNIWVDGEVKGKTTIVSANLDDIGVDTDVVLNNNISYTTKDGTDGLLLIAENNLLIPYFSPDNFELNGIFVAQKGKWTRDYYTNNIRNKLELYGSVVMKQKGATTWVNEDGEGGYVVVGGYRTVESTYDRKLMTDPPPMTPYADDEYNFAKWEEIE